MQDSHLYWCRFRGVRALIDALEKLVLRLELSALNLILSRIHTYPIQRYYQNDHVEGYLFITLDAPLLELSTDVESSDWTIQGLSKSEAQEWKKEWSFLLRLCSTIRIKPSSLKSTFTESGMSFASKHSKLSFPLWNTPAVKQRGLLVKIRGRKRNLEGLETKLLIAYAQYYILINDGLSLTKPYTTEVRSGLSRHMVFSTWERSQTTKYYESSDQSFYLHLMPSAFLFYTEFCRLLQNHKSLTYEVYQPLINDQVWQTTHRSTGAYLELYPQAKQLVQHLYSNRYIDEVSLLSWHSIESGVQLENLNLNWVDFIDQYYAIAHKLDESLKPHPPQLDSTSNQVINRFTSLQIEVAWCKLDKPYPKARALLLKDITLSQNLTHKLVHYLGLSILNDITFYQLPKDSIYTVAWIFNDSLVLDSLKVIVDSLQLVSSQFVLMSLYQDGLPTSGHPNRPQSNLFNIPRINLPRVWVPTGVSLSPHIPGQDLIEYLLQDYSPVRCQVLFLLDGTLVSDSIYRHGQEIYTLYSQQPGQKLASLFAIDVTLHEANSISPLDFLEPVYLSFDYNSGIRQELNFKSTIDSEINLDAEQLPQLKSTPVVDKTVASVDEQDGDLSKNIEDMQGFDLASPRPVEQEIDVTSNSDLRTQLRALSYKRKELDTLQRYEPEIPPQQKARQWLQQLDRHTPRLLTTVHLPDDWLNIAQRLWWIEEYERAIDALVWLVIESRVRPTFSLKNLQELLTGWQSRLFQSIKAEGSLLKYTRLSLFMLLQSNEDAKKIRAQHQETVYQLRSYCFDRQNNKLNYLWLFHYCFVNDDLLRLQAYEWSNRTLALGLSQIHCDSAIREQLIFEPAVQLSIEELKQDSESNQDSSSERIRKWGYILIETLREEVFELQSSKRHQLEQKTALLYEQVDIATKGLQMILYGHYNGGLNTEISSFFDGARMILSDEVSHCLLNRYRLIINKTNLPLGSSQAPVTHVSSYKSKCLSVLRSDPQLEFWRTYSSLNQRGVEASPLGASLKLCFEKTIDVEINTETLYIEESILSLDLAQALRRLRPRVRSYHSFKNVLTTSIDHALKSHNMNWLNKALVALDSWIKELTTIPTVPYEVLTQIDFELLRISYALSSSQEVKGFFEAWIKRWFIEPEQNLKWRQVIAFLQEFSSKVLDKLSGYVKASVLIDMVHSVDEHLDRLYKKLIETEQNHTLADMSLEKANYKLLLLARLTHFKLEYSNEIGLDRVSAMEITDRPRQEFEQGISLFVEALANWLREYEQSLVQEDVLLKKGFKSPLSSWLYQLQYLDSSQLNRLTEHLVKYMTSCSVSSRARIWFVIEDAFLSKPLFHNTDHPKLTIWLRGRERCLRQAWQTVFT